MAKISLWNPRKNLDYNFADRTAGESLRIGGVGVLVHKYIGPTADGEITDVQDFLFLENRDRAYENKVYELRCHYTPEDVDYDLSQFGIFLSSDTRRIVFHYNDMVDLLGRKLISGDVLEFYNDRDSTLDGASINSYFVIQDALYSAPGHSMTWYPHMWKVRGKRMPASEEYRDILNKSASGDTAGGEGDGTGIMPLGYTDAVDENGNPGFGVDTRIKDAMDRYCKILDVTDGVVKEAENNVFFDPKYFEVQHLWITINENGYPNLSYWAGGDGVPPNGAPLKGVGTKFPEDMVDGEYFLRVDYSPDRLFQKQGSCFVRIEDDLRKTWTAYNTRLDTFIDNINTTALDNGDIVRERQALSKVLSAKTDMNADKKAELAAKKEKRDAIAKKLDGAK